MFVTKVSVNAIILSVINTHIAKKKTCRLKNILGQCRAYGSTHCKHTVNMGKMQTINA